LLNNVFDGCKNIACVIIPKTLGKVCDSVFANCDSLSKIYYNGSSSDFKNIEVTSPYSRTGNASFAKATKYFYSAKRPTEEGNFWYHFGDELAEW
jgi:hypothetical protein